MQKSYQTRIVRLGNSKGVRIPKEYLAALGTTEVVLEQVENGIMMRAAHEKPPPRGQWAAILAKMDTTQKEEDLEDWDNMLADGIES
jgi:antitoxin MazE